MQTMLSVGRTVSPLSSRLAGLLILSVCTAGVPAGAAEPPLSWAGLEGAVLSCADRSCDNARDFLGRAFFYDANDTLVELYEFERSAVITAPIGKSEPVRLAHLERITAIEHRRGPMPDPPSWVTDPTAHYLVLRPESNPARELVLLIWRPTGSLKPGAAVFTSNDMDQFSRCPKPFQLAIREQRLLIGMTPAHVVMSRGRPQHRERVTDSAGITEVWSYGKAVEVAFAGGKVVRIREQLRP